MQTAFSGSEGELGMQTAFSGGEGELGMQTAFSGSEGKSGTHTAGLHTALSDMLTFNSFSFDECNTTIAS